VRVDQPTRAAGGVLRRPHVGPDPGPGQDHKAEAGQRRSREPTLRTARKGRQGDSEDEPGRAHEHACGESH
jgi:hypothetical protein